MVAGERSVFIAKFDYLEAVQEDMALRDPHLQDRYRHRAAYQSGTLG